MSYRFIWKRIASKAISSAVARALLNINREEIWDRLARTESLTPEQLARLKEDIDRTLKQVEEGGRKERDLVAEVAQQLASQFLGRRNP